MTHAVARESRQEGTARRRQRTFGRMAQRRALTSTVENAGMDVDADRLTKTLASRLAAIVPDGFHVRAADGTSWYSADEGRFPGQLSNYDAGSMGRGQPRSMARDGDSAAAVRGSPRPYTPSLVRRAGHQQPSSTRL